MKRENIEKVRLFFLRRKSANEISKKIHVHRSTIIRWLDSDYLIQIFKVRTLQLFLEMINRKSIAKFLRINISMVNKFLDSNISKPIVDLPKLSSRPLTKRNPDFNYVVFNPDSYYHLLLRLPNGHINIRTFIGRHPAHLKIKRAIQLYLEGIEPKEIAHQIGWNMDKLNTEFNKSISDHVEMCIKHNYDLDDAEFMRSKLLVNYSLCMENLRKDIHSNI